MKVFNSERPNTTRQQLANRTIHDWYRFVLSYPDHLVGELIDMFGIKAGQTVLDPFVGTGTTLIECMKRGIYSIGVDANPVTAFASKVKTNWNVDLVALDERIKCLIGLMEQPFKALQDQFTYQLSFDDLLPTGTILRETEITGEDETIRNVLPKNWISEKPLRKCLIIKQALDSFPEDAVTDVLRLALVKVFVASSNLGFGPEVYVSKIKKDADVRGLYLDQVRQMRTDLQEMQGQGVSAEVHHVDARCLTQAVQNSVDFVISSPPYPNEKDYSRITRLELILLGYVQNKVDLRAMKKEMLRSHTRNIYVADNDTKYIADIPEITSLAKTIEQRRIELGKTSGFEKLYHRVALEYFGGMVRVLREIETLMPVGGKIAFVVGDQMSYFRIPIYTAQLLTIAAERKTAFRHDETFLFRTRKSTVTKMDVEEHILVLERC